MAETVHPRLNSASASTSSPTENMAGGSSCWSAWTPPASRGPPPEWRTLQGARRPAQGVGNFSDREWGISVIRSTCVSCHHPLGGRSLFCLRYVLLRPARNDGSLREAGKKGRLDWLGRICTFQPLAGAHYGFQFR